MSAHVCLRDRKERASVFIVCALRVHSYLPLRASTQAFLCDLACEYCALEYLSELHANRPDAHEMCSFVVRNPMAQTHKQCLLAQRRMQVCERRRTSPSFRQAEPMFRKQVASSLRIVCLLHTSSASSYVSIALAYSSISA